MLPGSGNNPIWNVAGRQAFIKLFALDVYVKMGTASAGTNAVRICVHTNLAVLMQSDSRSLTPSN